MKKKMRKIASFFLAITLISQSPVGIMAGELDLFGDSAETVWMQPENRNENQPEETNSENTQRGIDTFEADADQSDVFFTDGDMGTDMDTSPEEPDPDAEEPYGENNDSEGQIGLEEEESLAEPDAEQGYVSGELSKDSEMPAFSAGTEESQELFMAGSTSGSYGSLKWSVNGSTLSITGSGEMQDAEHATYYPWYPYRSMITQITLGSGITSLGEAAFYGSGVQQISFPSTMRKISIAAFAECNSLKTVSLNEGLTTIEDYAFQNTAIETIELPASLTNMSSLAMWESRNLKTITVKSGNQTYAASDGVLFSRDKKTLIYCPINLPARIYTVPSGVTKIGVNAFCSSNLSEIKISSGVKELGAGVFYKSSIISLSLPDSVTKIGDFLCQDCINLTTVSTGNGLIALAYKTFSGCSSLRNVTLGTSLEDLDYLSFAECRSLESIVIPSKVKFIKNGSFGDCTSLSNVVFPSGLEEIWYQAFLNCSLSAITLPDGFKRVTRYAFYGTKLKEVTIPASVVEIGEHAFPDNTKLIFKRPLEQMEDNSYVNAKVVTMDVSYNYKDAFEVLRLVNNERASQGLAALTMDTSLLDSAMQRAAETSVLFSHTRPTGTSCFTINNKISGENIAAGQGSPSSAMDSWMNSSGHRANILGSYVSMGVGAVVVNGIHYWVQVFGGETAAKADASKYSNQAKATDIKFVLGNDEEDSVTIRTNLKEMTLEVGKTGTVSMGLSNTWIINWLDEKNLSYKSSNPNICEVSSNGLVTGKADGTVEITVFMKKNSDVNAKVKVTVGTGITIPANVSGLKIGGSAADALRLNWTRNPSATGYIIEQKKNGSWTRIKKIEGNTTVTYRVEKLSGSTRYDFRIKAYVWDSVSKVSTYSGYTNVSGMTLPANVSGMTLPANVSGLKIGGSAADALRLTWTRNPSATGYIIEQKKNGSWTRIKKIEGNTTVTFRVEKLSASTRYDFRIKAYVWDSVSKVSTYSGYTNVSGMTLPANVSGLKIGGSAADALRLTWTRNPSATGYIIEQKKNGSWTRIKKIEGNTTVTFRVEKLNASTRYDFRIKAYGWDSVSKVSTYSEYTYVSGMTPPTNVSGMTPPTNVSGLKIGGSAADALRLTWTRNPSATGYIIEQKKNGSWTRIKKVEGNTTVTYRVEKLSASTRYDFRIKAYSWDSVSKVSTYSGYTNVSGMTLPANVSGLKIGGSAADALRLTWTRNPSATGYIIEQKKNGSWTRIKKIEGNTTVTFRVEKLNASTRYDFRIKAYGWDSVSKVSTYSEYTYVSGMTPPTNVSGMTPPTNVSGLKIGGSAADALRLTWTRNPSATGYIIEQKKNGSWTRIKKVEGNTTVTYRVEKLSASTRYDFRIKAYSWDSVSKVSTYSGYTNVSGMTLPTNVLGLKIGGSAADALRLTWTRNPSATGYIIEQKKNGSWTRIKKIEGNTTVTFRVEKLNASTRYDFRIKAYGWDSVSKVSTYSEYTYVSGMTPPTNVSGMTPPTNVSGLKIGGSAADALRLTWTRNPSATGYIIEQKKNGSWTRIKKVEGNTTVTYRVEKLSASTRYDFRIKAYSWDSVSKVSTYSGYTNVSGMTLPTNVLGLKIGGSAADALRLTWTRNPSATGYIIEQKKNGSWTRIKKVEGNTMVTFRVEKLSASTRYDFRIKAYVWDSVSKVSTYSGYTYVSGMTLVSNMSGLTP